MVIKNGSNYLVNNLKTDVPNIHEKYNPALYKDFVFIEESVKKNNYK